MCGIYGIFAPARDEIPLELADRMRDAILSRGPDHSGRHVEPGAIIGMNRLAIVDLQSGNQPIYNEDESLLIVFNGEIYNHLDLREQLQQKGHVFHTRADTETILHAFEEYGPACVEKFNGMFAFAVFDRRAKRLFLARDRLGIKPLYLAAWCGGLAFASEAKGLLPALDQIRPDWTAINRFFSFGYVPSPDSPFLGIRKLPPGHYAWFDGATLKTTRYWQPEYGTGPRVDFQAAVEQVRELLSRAVRRELMSDVPVGIFLSGGLDSSGVAVFAKQHLTGPLHSYGLRFPEASHDESYDSRLVAQHLGITHHEVDFTEQERLSALIKVAQVLDEPFGDSTVLPLLVLSEFTHRDLKVVLTGWGGDEIFAGYPTYLAHRLARWYRRLPSSVSQGLIPALVGLLPVSDGYMSLQFKAKRFVRGVDSSPEHQHFLWMEYFDEPGKQRLFKPEILDQVGEEALAPVHRIIDELPERDLVSRIMHLDALYFLEGNGLFQADRMTMAASLEARVPLLNLELLNYVNSLGLDVKMPGGRLKYLLRQVLLPYLPERILQKPKKGFGPPTAAWVRGPFAQVFERLFTRERLESQGIFSYQEVQRLMEEHQRRVADHGRNLWALLSFQLWYERFILNSEIETLVHG